MKFRRILFSLMFTASLLFLSIPHVGAQQNTVDVRIWTQYSNGEPVTDICYVLVGYSNVGCDENKDGNVLFEDIPYGEYEVEPVYTDNSVNTVEPFSITVNESNTDFTTITEGGRDNNQTTDVYLLTRDPETGEALTDVCYELVGYSNIGCDENGDGRVLFEDIPYGQYTIHQTTTPEGYPAMDDLTVSVLRGNENQPLSILLSQSKEQAPEGTMNVSVVFYDITTNKLVANAENCAQLRKGNEAASNIGCDDTVVDGQVDFFHADWTAGDTDYSLRATPVCGYMIVQEGTLDFNSYAQQSVTVYIPVTPTGETCN